MHDGLALTKACLPTLLAQNGSPRILAVDNASTDGTYRWLGTQPVERMYGNFRSVSRMWNEALRYAWNEGFDRALLINNDTLTKPFLYEMLLAEQADFVTAVGVNTMEQFDKPPDPTLRRDNPDFSCAMISKRCWETMGGFDEAYIGAFAEDCRAHVSLHRLGIRAYCIGIPFFHVGSGTIKNASPAEQQRIRECAEHNRQLFFDTYGAHIGVPEEYDALFTPETFGINREVAADRA